MLKNSPLLTFALSAAFASIPVCASAVPHHQDKTARVTYRFSAHDKAQLRPHYLASHPNMNLSHSWTWHRGVNLPAGWQDQVEPLADADIAMIAPPPPAGYRFGYYKGWAIVYDPDTGVVLDAINLM
jgi:hypothetical protein